MSRGSGSDSPGSLTADGSGQLHDELGLELVMAYHMYHNLVMSCLQGAAINRVAVLDLLVLQCLCRHEGDIGGRDVSSLLPPMELHVVNYSLKKLVRLGMAVGEKDGRRVYYRSTAKGRESYSRFMEEKARRLSRLPDAGEKDTGLCHRFHQQLVALRELRQEMDQLCRERRMW